MAKCTGSGRYMNSAGGAPCSTCPLTFHKTCVGIPDNGDIPNGWSCPECKQKYRRGDNTNTPVKGITGPPPPPPDEDTATGRSQSQLDALSPLSSTTPSTVVTEVTLMRRELAEYMAELREFRSEMRSTLAGMVERMDGFERRLDVVEQRKEEPAAGVVAELQTTVTLLKFELNDRDQESLLSDLDIGLLPEEKGENIIQKVTVLAAKLGVALETRDVVFAERVGAVGAHVGSDGGVQQRPRRVVVRLARRQLRDDLINAARVRRTLSTTDLGISGPPRRFYMNERLTKTNRLLFSRARQECRNRQWRFAWTKRGRVYVRRADGTQVYPIRSLEDITRVFNV